MYGAVKIRTRSECFIFPFQGFLVESKLTKLLAPLERDEQSLMKLDAIFAVRIYNIIQCSLFKNIKNVSFDKVQEIEFAANLIL